MAMKTRMVALGALAMMCGVTAWAGKPETYPYGPRQVIGEEVANCGDFLVLTDYSIEGFARFYLNKDGSFRLLLNLVAPESIYYNSEDPSYWLPGTAENISQWYYFNANDEAIYWVTTGAPFRVILPGYGPVFMNVGRVKLDIATQEFTFIAGQFDNLNGNLDAICAALRP
jgi:hypothetical protein